MYYMILATHSLIPWVDFFFFFYLFLDEKYLATANSLIVECFIRFLVPSYIIIITSAFYLQMDKTPHDDC